MKLAIISHTEHYKDANDNIVGWGPTVNEINHLLEVFDTIYHVAMFYECDPPSSSLPYISERIIFVPLPALGGKSTFDKLRIIFRSLEVMKTVNATLKKADYFQLRTPTGIGVFLIPFLTVFVKKNGWYKYAGNWNQKNPPLGYFVQRTMLKWQQRKVTINGQWPNQPTNCLTFENPCLTMSDIDLGNDIRREKTIEGKIEICYVGRLEKQKGVAYLIESIGRLSKNQKHQISKVHLVGNGEDLQLFKIMAAKTDVEFLFHGFLSRNKVFEIYQKCQIFLMPTTASEGFPKAIAEAMNFGCIPVVSTVSSIGQYIKHFETGICIENVTIEKVIQALNLALNLKHKDYQEILTSQRRIIELFSFPHYNHRIKTELLN
ncbi:MAG: glycosyltransferase [Gelidibacter sp.]